MNGWCYIRENGLYKNIRKSNTSKSHYSPHSTSLVWHLVCIKSTQVLKSPQQHDLVKLDIIDCLDQLALTFTLSSLLFNKYLTAHK